MYLGRIVGKHLAVSLERCNYAAEKPIGKISPKTILNSQVLERVFTLSGMHVNGQPTRPGIYLVNGKKTVIK